MQFTSFDHQKRNEKGESRRAFLKQSGVAAALLATNDPLSLAAKGLIDEKTGAKEPWFRNAIRWGQVNITEKDPPSCDIAWWRRQPLFWYF